MPTYDNDPASCSHVAVMYGPMFIHENGPHFPFRLRVKPFGGEIESTSAVNEDDIFEIIRGSRFFDFLFKFDIPTDWGDAVFQIF